MTSEVKMAVSEGADPFDVDGKGIGVVDALFEGLLTRYAREYQSLKTIQFIGFKVAADIETKKAQAGVDAVGRVTIDVTNSEGKHFTFSDASRSVTISIARSVLAMVQFFFFDDADVIVLPREVCKQCAHGWCNIVQPLVITFFHECAAHEEVSCLVVRVM